MRSFKIRTVSHANHEDNFEAFKLHSFAKGLKRRILLEDIFLYVVTQQVSSQDQTAYNKSTFVSCKRPLRSY